VSRLPYLRRDQLGPQGQEVWDKLAGSRDTRLLTAGGGLAGPFNAFVHAPVLGQHLTELGLALRYQTSVDRRLTEVAIITIGARWKAEFEWWAHAAMARRHGVIEAIGQGEEPPFTTADERVVWQVARELGGSGRLSQPTHDAARDLLGDTGLVELVTLCGYYTLISYLLNAFDVPLPPGTPPAWPTGDAQAAP
jgi:4-carboxymuconolactone decarboxylase